jgi:hypothetical protein
MTAVEWIIAAIIITELPDRQEAGAEKEAKFAKYRLARAKKINAFGDKTYEDVYDKITKEELDYYLKKRLQVPPEQRYQRIKQNSFFHESNWSVLGLNKYDEQGCNQFTECVPECRFYPDKGRIEDEETLFDIERK